MGSLIRRDPYSDVVSLRDLMDRLFEQSLMPPRLAETGLLDMAMDMYETDNEVVIKLTAPGVQPDDLEVTVEAGTVRIKGEVKSEENIEDANYVRRERRFGRFQRVVSLPSDVNPDAASADFENGLLTLKIPKKEEMKAKTVQVKAK